MAMPVLRAVLAVAGQGGLQTRPYPVKMPTGQRERVVRPAHHERIRGNSTSIYPGCTRPAGKPGELIAPIYGKLFTS